MANGTHKLRVLTGEIRNLDISPFKADTLWSAGHVKNWADLRRILKPVVDPDFVVTDVVTQVFLDGVRHVIDSSINPQFGGGLVLELSCSDASGDAELLEMVLSVGADPDRPCKKGWRPSHSCAARGRIKAAGVVFPCRPDMAAVNLFDDTPLDSAQKLAYKNDLPQWKLLRPEIEKFIIQEEFHLGKFPSIAKLACFENWVAVKNLIRRQVVPKSEYALPFGEKTAVEWAMHYEADLIAKEIDYYAGLPTSSLLDAEATIKSLTDQLEGRTAVKVEALETSEAGNDVEMTHLRESKNLLEADNRSLQQQVDAMKSEISALEESLAKKEAEVSKLKKRCVPDSSSNNHSPPAKHPAH